MKKKKTVSGKLFLKETVELLHKKKEIMTYFTNKIWMPWLLFSWVMSKIKASERII